MANILIGENMSKINEIPVLKKITKLDNVADYARLADFVYATIPHAMDSGITLDHSINQLYWQFVNKKKFGWCYMHALYYHLILQEYNRDSYIYDYGLPVPQLTHTVVIITLRDEQFLIDPYFNRYYINNEGNPYSYYSLLKMINKDPNQIHSKYGPSVKDVKAGDVFNPVPPQEFEAGVLNSWKVNQEYDKRMMKNFNSTNALHLITRKLTKMGVCKKADGSKYFEKY